MGTQQRTASRTRSGTSSPRIKSPVARLSPLHSRN
jgi:hypothetical protein